MIQRIQTVYLALATILLVLPVLLETSFIVITDKAGTYSLTALGIVFLNGNASSTVLNSYPLIGAMVLGLFLSVYAIAQFKSRPFQVKLVRLALVIQLVFVGLIIFYFTKMESLVAETIDVNYSPFLAIPLVCMVLFFLAARGIKKDEELVRSADRLR